MPGLRTTSREKYVDTLRPDAVEREFTSKNSRKDAVFRLIATVCIGFVSRLLTAT
jgi:hypothetical protein